MKIVTKIQRKKNKKYSFIVVLKWYKSKWDFIWIFVSFATLNSLWQCNVCQASKMNTSVKSLFAILCIVLVILNSGKYNFIIIFFSFYILEKLVIQIYILGFAGVTSEQVIVGSKVCPGGSCPNNGGSCSKFCEEKKFFKGGDCIGNVCCCNK